MKSIHCLLLIAFWTLAAPLRAEALLVGHFAAGQGPVDLRINGQLVVERLHFLEVVSIDSALGELSVVASSAGSTTTLSEQQIELKTALTPLQPMVMLTSAGAGGTPLLFFEQEPAPPLFGWPDYVPTLAATSIINVSAFVSTRNHGGPNQFQFGLQCIATRSSGDQSGLPQLQPITGMTSVDARGENRCNFQFGLVGAGAFSFTDVWLYRGKTTRFLLVGNGGSHPYQLVIVTGAEVVAMPENPPIEPGPTLVSDQFWFDRSRPAQGVSLFEMPGAGLLYGTWQTFDQSGEPVWYVLDGTARSLPGDRDITIYSADTANGLQLTPVGSGRLTYFNCNLAEARFALSGEEVRFLRLERAVAVDQCFALE